LLPPHHTALARRELSPGPEPLGTLERLRGRAQPWLLDSALRVPGLARFSFAGADPWLVLRATGRRVELDCRRAVRAGEAPGRRLLDADPFAVLRSLLPKLDHAGDPSSDVAPPFVGGAVGFFGYELAELQEELGAAPLDDRGLPDGVFLFVDRLLAWDHATGRSWAIGLGFGASPGQARAAAESSAAEAAGWWVGEVPHSGHASRCSAATGTQPVDTLDEGLHAKAVHALLDDIGAGRVYQACLTHRLTQEFRGDPWRLYRELRRRNPAPYACYLELPEVTVVGSSPERFLRLDRSRKLESRPIKGTRPRGRHPHEDTALRAELERSAKDRAENLMIVDLVRNDLGRVCELGSVEVPELMAIEEYSGVFQMVSTVTGQLRADCDVIDAVQAAFPPGSMTGAPKIAAMRLLRRLEPVRRGVYAGALGYLDARGGADLAVVIRTLLLRDGRADVHTGGGIVADSDARAEWQESLDKARPLLAALAGTHSEG